MNMIVSAAFVISAIVLSGCTASAPTFGPDGRVAHTVSCGGVAQGWDDCFRKAGVICQRAGYDVVDRTSAPRAVATAYFAGVTSDRSMVVSCKA